MKWREVEGYSGVYEVSDDGRVRSVDRIDNAGRQLASRELTQFRHHKSGHMVVTLCTGGKPKSKFVHRLVLEAFLGACPSGMECCHLNGDPSDNRVSNLRWGTRKENKRQGVFLGESPRGSKNGNAKLNPDKVREIRDLFQRGVTQKNIAIKFDIHPRYVSLITSRKRWNHV